MTREVVLHSSDPLVLTEVRFGPTLRGVIAVDLEAPLVGRTVLLAVPDADCPSALAVLEAAGATVTVVPDIAALRRAAALLGPSALVVADLRAGPDQLRSGLLVLARQEAVVVLANTIMSAERSALLRDGADHVARSGEPAEVVAMLSAVLRRSRRSPRQLAKRHAGDIGVDVVQRAAQVRGRPLRLTAREFDLLAYFVTNPGAVLSREKLLADVWGFDVGGLSTVTVHIRRLRRKLEADPSAPEYIKTIWRMGYRLDPSPLP